MAFKCTVCGKGPVSGNKVSHSNRHSRRKWKPNLQNVKVKDGDSRKTIKVCTNCIKSGRIEKAL